MYFRGFTLALELSIVLDALQRRMPMFTHTRRQRKSKVSKCACARKETERRSRDTRRKNARTCLSLNQFFSLLDARSEDVAHSRSPVARLGRRGYVQHFCVHKSVMVHVLD